MRSLPRLLAVLVVTTLLGLAVAPAASAGSAGSAAAGIDPRGAFRGDETPNPPGAPGEKVVSLTFDDGPQPTYTPKVLAVLTHYGLRATFFEIGRQADHYPDLVKQVVAQGSVVANHTWDHQSLRSLDDARFAFEVDHTTEALERISGQHVVCARPPYGDSDPRVVSRLGARGLTSVLWTSDSQDFARPGVATIVKNAMDHLQPGGIILFHDGGGNRDETVAALPIVIERILAAGYRIAPVCAPDPHAPIGGITAAAGGKSGRIAATGWASDPDSHDPIDVHLYVDGTFAMAVKADERATPGPGWRADLQSRPGPHQICAYAINVGAGSGNPGLGCATLVVPPITAFDDLLPLVAQVRYTELREQAMVTERVVRLHDARRLPWRVGQLSEIRDLGRPGLAQ